MQRPNPDNATASPFGMKKIPTLSPEGAVQDRYAAAAGAPEAALCCPIQYDPKYLTNIPQEVIDKDYGCGDPSRHLNPGETVLDLGSGTGKICFIAAQVVGPEGRVIGIDMTEEMLAIARRNAPIVAGRIGYANIEFRKGRIQDLALDLECLDRKLEQHPITNASSYLAAERLAEELRLSQPLVPDHSIDVVVSNCVLNLVDPKSKTSMFKELFRVLKPGGRAVISDIVSDEPVPEHLQNDPKLWSGCISGAFTEEGFLQAFADAGFYGIEIVQRDDAPWQTVEGIEFRSVTIRAFKGSKADCLERNQAVIYLGPFKKVLDDDNHAMERGVRYAVCDKTWQIYRKAPYIGHFAFVEPRVGIPVEQAQPYAITGMQKRDPRATKGLDYKATTGSSQCGDGSSCC